MKHDYIPIKKKLIPYRFNIELAGEIFTVRVDYNSYADLFSLALYKNNVLVCAGEPLIYGSPLWQDVYKAGSFPALKIVPLDESGAENTVTFENLGNTVFLCILDREDD